MCLRALQRLLGLFCSCDIAHITEDVRDALQVKLFCRNDACKFSAVFSHEDGFKAFAEAFFRHFGDEFLAIQGFFPVSLDLPGTPALASWNVSAVLSGLTLYAQKSGACHGRASVLLW